jgi:hypothetical protein
VWRPSGSPGTRARNGSRSRSSRSRDLSRPRTRGSGAGQDAFRAALWGSENLRRAARPAGVRAGRGPEGPCSVRAPHLATIHSPLVRCRRGLPTLGRVRIPRDSVLLHRHRTSLEAGPRALVRRPSHGPGMDRVEPKLSPPRAGAGRPLPGPFRGGGPGCTSRVWFWFLVASFHPRFGPPSPFHTTLTGYPSPGSSGMFHPVTLMGFGFRQKYLPGGFPRRRARGPSDAVCPPRSHPLHRDEDHRSGPASIPFPASRGAVRGRSWERSLRGVRPFAKRFRARPGRDATRPT